MKIYLDTNVMLDFVLGREPFGMEAAQVISLARRLNMEIVTSPNAFVMAYFYVYKITRNPGAIKHSLALTRKLIDCVNMDGRIIDKALARNKPIDLEDGVQIEAALASKADIFLTNDKKLQRQKAIRVMSTARFVLEFAIV